MTASLHGHTSIVVRRPPAAERPRPAAAEQRRESTMTFPTPMPTAAPARQTTVVIAMTRTMTIVTMKTTTTMTTGAVGMAASMTTRQQRWSARRIADDDDAVVVAIAPLRRAVLHSLRSAVVQCWPMRVACACSERVVEDKSMRRVYNMGVRTTIPRFLEKITRDRWYSDPNFDLLFDDGNN